MFGKMLLHSPVELMCYAITIVAVLALSPMLLMLVGALGFLFLPAAIVGIPFMLWTFFVDAEKEHEAAVRRHDYAAHHPAHAHAHA